MVPSKSTPHSKLNPDGDPHLTPWEEREEKAPMHPTRPRGRSLRDWFVLGMAVLLSFYVILFLVGGAESTPSRGGNFFSGGTIAVLPIHGEIASSTGSASVGFPEVIAALDEADNDPSIQVIFLDIDSGGGSVVASKQMVAKIRETEKPVVAWIGEVGASGGYYVASASDYVMADSDSITGSIGVITMQPTFVELMQKIGVKMETIKTGDMKDAGSPFAEMTDEQRAVLQGLVEQAFDHFKSDVVSFRGDKLNQTKFNAILDGRIVSGQQASDIGLIDATGTREQAIAKAAELGGIQGTPDFKYYLEKTFALSDLLFASGSQFGKGFKASWVSESEAGASALDAK